MDRTEWPLVEGRPALRLALIRRVLCRVPHVCGKAVQIVNTLAVAQRELADKPFCAHHLRVVHIHKAECAALDREHCHIRTRSYREVAESLLLDLMCRMRGHLRDHLGNG